MIQGYRRFLLEDVREEQLVVGDDNLPIHKIVNNYKLKGAHGYLWDGQELQASCGSNRAEKYLQETAYVHLTTGECRCGIYITKTQVPGAGVTNAYLVDAFMTGWGAFVEYDAGWRTQFARIESLKILGHERTDGVFVKEDLERIYQVPVEISIKSTHCCDREHDPILFRTQDRREVPICKLTREELKQQYDLAKLISGNVYGNARLEFIREEFRARGLLYL